MLKILGLRQLTVVQFHEAVLRFSYVRNEEDEEPLFVGFEPLTSRTEGLTLCHPSHRHCPGMSRKLSFDEPRVESSIVA